jgi:hypothetical protein
MVPLAYFPFFAASTGAGAALIGLLFVAISIAPEHMVAETAPVERQTRATSAFTALFNAFFVSLVALMPNTNVGGVGVTMGAIGLINSVGIAMQLARRQRGWRALTRGAFLLAASFVLYGMQTYVSISLLRDYRSVGAVEFLAFLMIVAYGIGLSRAWELLGARRYGFSSLIGLLLSASHPSATVEHAASQDRQQDGQTARPTAASTARDVADA